MLTGYNDTFQRTVSGGLGTATSGQVYSTAAGAGAISNVSAGIAAIGPAAANNTNYIGYVDRLTADIDITGQVALASVPATNLATVGFTAKQTTNQNYYIGSFMVSSLSVMSLRISKVIGGTLTTLNTTAVPGLGTYTAGTYFNIRFQCYWSNLLQANVLNIKIWAIGGTEPGGWLVSITDASITQYTSGTSAGLHFRDEATTPANTGRFQNVSTKTYGLPVPATTDPMCNDPSIAYPDQTALQSLATAADTQLVALDPTVDLANLYPRVRVSANNLSYNTNNQSVITWDTTEFNIDTPTNLSYDNTGIYLGPGLWVLACELRMNTAGFNSLYMYFNGGPTYGQWQVGVHSNGSQGTTGVGGTGHLSSLTAGGTVSSPNQYSVSFGSFIAQSTYTIQYAALSAIQISDSF